MLLSGEPSTSVQHKENDPSYFNKFSISCKRRVEIYLQILCSIFQRVLREKLICFCITKTIFRDLTMITMMRS